MWLAEYPNMELHEFGPIHEACITKKKFMVLNGPQASGKSTLSKAWFFFRTLKDVIAQRMIRTGSTDRLAHYVRADLRLKFIQLFGSSWAMRNDMRLHYAYTQDVFVDIYLVQDNYKPNYIWIKLSDTIEQWLTKQQGRTLGDGDQKSLQKELNELFNDDIHVVYIPASRNTITLLTNQINYILLSMDDEQKRLIDYATLHYIREIQKIKPQFSMTADVYFEDFVRRGGVCDTKLIKILLSSMDEILQGRYQNTDGEERLWLLHDTAGRQQYVKINFASSGQQEVLWILNLIFYYGLTGEPVSFIIEEPESNLFPETQKKMAEYISLLMALGDECWVTTHSPYILGALNNLLYAGHLDTKGLSAASVLQTHGLDKAHMLYVKQVQAYYLNHGLLDNAIDPYSQQIRNELIDQASDDINAVYDHLEELEES